MDSDLVLVKGRSEKPRRVTPHHMVTLLYEAACYRSAEAARALHQGDSKVAHQAITIAAKLVAQLMTTVDLAEDGEIGQMLFLQFKAMHSRLVQANERQDPQGVEEVAVSLDKLAETWRRIGCSDIHPAV